MMPLESIFKHYCNEREFLCFDEWFEVFWGELNTRGGLKKDLKPECEVEKIALELSGEI